MINTKHLKLIEHTLLTSYAVKSLDTDTRESGSERCARSTVQTRVSVTEISH